MKKFISIILCLALLVMCVACGSKTETPSGSTTGNKASAEKVTLKMSVAQPEEHQASQAARMFAEKVAEKSGGSLDVKIYYANSLGAQDVLVQGMMDGSVDLVLEFIDASYNQKLDITNLPFIATTYKELEYLYSEGSNLYKILKDGFAEFGLHMLGVFIEGSSGLSCSQYVEGYNDYTVRKPLPIRTWNSSIAVAAWDALGYNTVTMTWSDVYSSIQTGIVYGSTGQTAQGVHINLRDVVNYYIPYNYGPEQVHLNMSEVTWKKLSAEQQAAVQAAADETFDYVFENLPEMEQAGYDMLAEDGIEVLPLTDAELSNPANHVRDVVWDSQSDVFGADALQLLRDDLASVSN